MTILLVSGGIDSYVAASGLPAATKLFVDYGQSYLKIERRAVRELYGDQVKIVSLPGLPPLDSKNVHVPARNLLLACLAVRFDNKIVVAGVKDEQCSDKSPAAFKAMSSILSRHCNRAIEVTSTLWSHTKDQAIALYLAKGGDPGKLLKTVSCYSNGDEPCNNCDSCFRRAVALRCNGIDVPLTDTIIASWLSNLQRCDTHRVWAIMRAIKQDLIVHRHGSTTRPVPKDSKWVVVTSDRPKSERTAVVRELGNQRYDALLMEII